MTAALSAVIERACTRVAPTWPLDQLVAVHPWWGMIDRPITEVAAEIAALGGTRMVMPRAWYRAEWRAGRFDAAHLDAARVECRSPRSPAELVAALERDAPAPPRRGTLVDVVDALRGRARPPTWRDLVVTHTSQACAAFFDDGQATVAPDRAGGLYASWRRATARDPGPGVLMGLPTCRALVAALPESPLVTIADALAALAVPADEHERYLAGLLLDVHGWAAWCAYRRWTARLAGADAGAIVELLAIRIAWEWILLRADPSIAARWQRELARWPEAAPAAAAAQADDWVFQVARERAWHAELAGRLARPPLPATTPAIQAVFCIDVRSEPLRRALEAESPAIQTLGFAGFFGVPVAVAPAGPLGARPHVPALLAPELLATVAPAAGDTTARRDARLDLAAIWRGVQTSAASAVPYVEALGLAAVGGLLRDSVGAGAAAAPDLAGLTRAEAATRAPRLVGRSDGSALSVTDRVDLAERILRGMSLVRDLAPLVALVGHGSDTRNNPHAAALDCGACGGQTGEVSARLAAELLDEPDVRAGLAARGVAIPAGTRFVAALHHTTTDEVTLFASPELAATHGEALTALRDALAAAGARTRAERAPALGITETTPAALRAAVHARARDWAEVRPEWGLANNAALIVGPRALTRGLDLAGRAFLHEYRADDDPSGAVLAAIMTAPMLVTAWINAQYYASTVAPERYGSGTKVLHNVVGGHIGVFEGNGGDLRIGLPLQSVHDGERWLHTPLRLAVVIAAPRPAIEQVLGAHTTVRHLVENAWLALFQLDEATGALARYHRAAWAAA